MKLKKRSPPVVVKTMSSMVASRVEKPGMRASRADEPATPLFVVALSSPWGVAAVEAWPVVSTIPESKSSPELVPPEKVPVEPEALVKLEETRVIPEPRMDPARVLASSVDETTIASAVEPRSNVVVTIARAVFFIWILVIVWIRKS